jgi:hypothetical protein
MNTTTDPQTPASTGANTGGQAATDILPEASTTASTASSDPHDRAFYAAQAKLATKNSSASESAAGDGASTQGAADTTTTEKPGETQTGANSLAIPANQASATAAPQHWPEEIRTKFEGLSEEARPLVMDFYKGMQSAFTQGTQALKQREAELGELISLEQQFKANPRSVLEALAKEAKIELFFELPLPEGEVPEFENAADMAKWSTEQALKKLKAEQAQAEDARNQEARQAQARSEFKADLEAAAAMYPDFVSHKEGIMSALAENPALSVDQAYRLATYEGLRQLAIEGHAAKKELATLQTKIETQRANATRPGPAGSGDPASTKPPTDSHDAAFQRAQQRLAARH